jgi:serine protease Do
LATGHPGGYDPDRPPVLRWGRVLKTDDSAILSDCTLVGGDSGGPLFDLQGRVIGIHSRIGKNLTINVHVPIDPYRESWDRLVRSEIWDPIEEAPSDSGPGSAWLGVVENPRAAGATIEKVAPGSPAAEAGILAGDRITQFNDKKVESFEDLQKYVRESVPGSMVRVRLARDNESVDLQLTLAARPEAND